MQRVLLLIVIFLVILFGVTYFVLRKNAQVAVPIIKEVLKEEAVKPQIEIVAKGIKRPHGIAFNNGIVYVSSETDKALYKVTGSVIERFADLDFTHDVIFESDGSIITPVFNEQRVVKIKPNGTIQTLYSGFDGPNGIVFNKFGYVYVSNYNSGRILTTRDGVNFSEVTAGDLKGSAGIAYDKETNSIWVAGFLGNTISMYGLGDSEEAEIRRPRTFHYILEGVIHPESIFVRGSKSSKVLITAVKNGKGVVIESDPQGKYKVILETDLPDPVVGYFTEDGLVFLVSPNDPEGRILKARIN